MSQEHAASGKRDRLVRIEKRPDEDAKAPSNYPIEEWETLADVWMNKYDIGARERFSFQSNQESAPYDTRWTLPWMASMDPETVDVRKVRRLVVNNRVHDIVAANEIGRREGIELQTLAGGPVEAE